MRVLQALIIVSALLPSTLLGSQACFDPLKEVAEAQNYQSLEEIAAEYANSRDALKKYAQALDNKALILKVQEWMDKTAEEKGYLHGLTPDENIVSVDTFISDASGEEIMNPIGNMHGPLTTLNGMAKVQFTLDVANEAFHDYQEIALPIHLLLELHQRITSRKIN